MKHISSIKKTTLLLPLIFIILISGCTIPFLNIEMPWFGNGAVEYEDDIIIIKNIRPSPSASIVSGQTLTVYADIQNIEAAGGETKKVSVSMYDYCTNLFEKKSCEAGAEKKDCENIELLPRQTKQIKWELIAKDVNLKVPCDLKVKVTYEHETETITQITFIDPAVLDVRIQNQEPWQIQGSSAIGYGPVKPYLKVETQQPVSAGTDAPVSLQIKNLGHGYVENSAIKEIGPIEGEGLSINCNPSDDYKQLINKQSSKYFCTVKKDNVDIEQTFDLRTKIKYNYEFRKTTKVYVEPRPRV